MLEEDKNLQVFYGHPEVAKREEAWDLLSHLKQYDPVPCLCMGDFNEIIDNSKECGAALRQKGTDGRIQKNIGGISSF